ncbi:hypothetical protein DIPPA_25120 [Diplonema papillatum]|nr:hypothetical protein DIPPA_25120 [Diplonema papillatum]
MPTPTRAEASGGARNFQKRLFSDLARTEQTAKERLARHDAATTRCVVADWIRRESIRRELFPVSVSPLSRDAIAHTLSQKHV